MKRNKQVAIGGVLISALALRVLRRGRRRRNAEPDEPAVQPALPALADIEPQHGIQIDRDVEVIDEPQPVSAAKPWIAAMPEVLQPYFYVRVAQVLLALLTLAGSALQGVTFSRGQPIAGLLITMGLLHVGTLEAILQTVRRLKLRHTTHARIGAPAEPVEPVPAAAEPIPVAAEAEATAEEVAVVLAATGGPPAAITDVLPYTVEQISGMWVKDRQRSSSMAPVCDAMHLFGLLRHAIKILRGSYVSFTATSFDVAAVSVIPLLKISERYPLDGSETKNRRRDQRGGGSMGRAEATPEGMVVYYRWDAPYPGTIRELFRLTPDGEMHIVATGVIEGEPYEYTLIHRRPGAA